LRRWCRQRQGRPAPSQLHRLSGGAAPAPSSAPEPAPDPEAGIYLVSPIVEFPREAMREGINGRCDVLFRVTEQGIPQDLRPTCNSPLFEAAAVRGIMRARLNMASGGIRPGAWLSVPLIFRLEQELPQPEG
jgi:outer membrane biosynthesis protein TonB